MRFSFIDYGLKDFLRDFDLDPIVIHADSWEDAEDWLLNNGRAIGWTNSGVKYINWDE